MDCEHRKHGERGGTERLRYDPSLIRPSDAQDRQSDGCRQQQARRKPPFSDGLQIDVVSALNMPVAPLARVGLHDQIEASDTEPKVMRGDLCCRAP